MCKGGRSGCGRSGHGPSGHEAVIGAHRSDGVLVIALSFLSLAQTYPRNGLLSFLEDTFEYVFT